jgi:hypothetical protein
VRPRSVVPAATPIDRVRVRARFRRGRIVWVVRDRQLEFRFRVIPVVRGGAHCLGIRDIPVVRGRALSPCIWSLPVVRDGVSVGLRPTGRPVIGVFLPILIPLGRANEPVLSTSEIRRVWRVGQIWCCTAFSWVLDVRRLDLFGLGACFVELSKGAIQGSLVRFRVATDPFARVGVVERQAIGESFGVPLGAFCDDGGFRLDLFDGSIDDRDHDLAFFLLVVGVEHIGPLPRDGLSDVPIFLAAHLAFELNPGRLASRIDRPCTQPQFCNRSVPDTVSRLSRQKAGGLEFVHGLPGIAGFQKCAEPCPFVEHPAASGCGFAEFPDESIRVVGMDRLTGIRGAFRGEVIVEDPPGLQGPVVIEEQPLAEFIGLFLFTIGCGFDDRRDAGGLHAIGASEQPRGAHSAEDQHALDFVARQKDLADFVHAPLKIGGLLARQNKRRCC